jgi:hypothetical protein
MISLIAVAARCEPGSNFHTIRGLRRRYTGDVSTARFVHWQDHGMWLGYFEEFPDYLTQGETLEQLQENLRDLYNDLMSGEIPGIRRVSELNVG